MSHLYTLSKHLAKSLFIGNLFIVILMPITILDMVGAKEI